MRNKLVAFLGVVLGVFLVSASAFAHHGSAGYDTTKLTTVKGTVTEVQFINPHVQIYIEVKDDKGHVEKWDGEASNTLALHRHGWNSKTLHVGEVVTFVGNRAKDGSNYLRLKKVILADGKELDPFPSSY